MKHGLSALAIVVLALSGSPVAAKPVVTVGFVVDGPWERNQPILDVFRGEMSDLLESDFEVRYPVEALLTADYTQDAVRRSLDRLLADPSVDLIVAMGLLASLEAGTRGPLPKPVIAPFVLDHQLQGIPWKDGASGVRNLCYIESPASLSRELRAFHEITPFRTVAFLANGYFLRALPDLGPEAAAVEEDLDVTLVPMEGSGAAQDVLNALSPEVDAVYMVPLLQLKAGEFETLVQGLHARGIPTFSYLGRTDVERGVLAGLAADDFFTRVARRVALNAQRILLGGEAGALPVAIQRRDELVINMAAARTLGIDLSFRILTEATLLDERRTAVERTLSLRRAVEEAVTANLDLEVADRQVMAGHEEIPRARAQLLPQVDLQSLGTLIDEDRAASSFGSAAQRTWSAKITATQLLWSDRAWANLSIQKHLQEARLHDRAQVRLDITQAAARAYLDVLRAKTFEQLQKDNLKLSRSNLELAQIRESVGVSGPAEVYRWRSRIASEQREVIAANARRNLAEMALNRILHRPLEESFGTEEADLEGAHPISSDPRFTQNLASRARFRAVRQFLAQEGIAASPEIQRIDATIAAQERRLRAAHRSFFSPDVVVRGELGRDFATGGSGSDFAAPEPLDDLLETADETDWSVSLSLSIPLSEGGSRLAESRQAGEELRVLRLQRSAAVERVEQRVRSALHLAGASFAGIALAQESAEAAGQNLDLVTAAYSRGVLQVIDLLDAQSAALSAQLIAANAVYDFLIDLMEVERAIGNFGLLSSPDEREDWLRRLERHREDAREEEQ